MDQFQVGDIHVQRIVELEDLFIPISDMLPDAAREDIARHRQWLEPWALCPDTGRMVLPVQTYLVRTSRHTILVDTCVGNCKSNTFFAPWHNRNDLTWMQRLAAAGVGPADVDFVLCTHMHLDHTGWNTQLVDGRWVPTFPKARYLFAREEFEHRQGLADSTFMENVVPVMDAGQGVIVAMDHALDDQVWLEPTPGHTPGHVTIHLASNGQQAVLMGDLMHSPVQCAEPDWRAVSDGDPDLARATRRRFLDQHVDTDTLVMTAHFPSPSVGRVVPHADAFRMKFV